MARLWLLLETTQIVEDALDLNLSFQYHYIYAKQARLKLWVGKGLSGREKRESVRVGDARKVDITWSDLDAINKPLEGLS